MTPTARRWLLGTGVWLVLALLSATQHAVGQEVMGREANWGYLLPRSLISWFSCAVFTPVFFAAARRFPIDPEHWIRHTPIHLGLCAVATVGKFALERWAMVALLAPDFPTLGALLVRSFVPENIAFWAMAAVIHAVEFQRRASEREVLTARLQARLSEAQLQALASRLQPHFLFNTLQGISTLVYRDPAGADRMLGHLSVLLRKTLQASPRHEVPLSEELSLLDEYLAIAQARFGERVTIHRAIDEAALPGLVPFLALQPLVENAFEHGIARRRGAGFVGVAARRTGNDLSVEITDDGPGLEATLAEEGIGLGTTRERLRELYGDEAGLLLAPRPEGGTVVTLTVPWHTRSVSPTGVGA